MASLIGKVDPGVRQPLTQQEIPVQGVARSVTEAQDTYFFPSGESGWRRVLCHKVFTSYVPTVTSSYRISHSDSSPRVPALQGIYLPLTSRAEIMNTAVVARVLI